MADADKPDTPEAAPPAETPPGEDTAAEAKAQAKPKSRSRAKAAPAPRSPSAADETAGGASPAAEPAAESATEPAGRVESAGEAETTGEVETAAAPARKPARKPAKRAPDSKAAQTESAADEEAGGPAEAEPAPDVPAGRAGLKLHHLRPAPGARKAKTRVGRGEASKGKTAGRGTKGTRARDKVAPRFEGGQMPLHRRVPKLKGFSNAKFTTTYQVVNTGRLAELYPDGGEVTPDDLVARGAVRKGELVKVLGLGDVSSALRVTAHAFSASAKEKITAAGGTVTEL
jgi:large subunit ribosomal protein L15